MLAVLVAVATAAPPPLLSRAESNWLHSEARRLVAACRLAPHSGGGGQNTTKYTMYVPGANMGYPAFWVRDAAMMLGSDLVPAADVADSVALTAAAINPDRLGLHPGADVPAWSVPDHIEFMGGATFYPGTYATGPNQGGPPFGRFPPLDDAFWFLFAVAERGRLQPGLRLTAPVSTQAGSMPLWRLCERVYAAIPTDPATGLVIAGDPDTANAKDWGFCDSIFKSGRLLFPSLLRYRAARLMAPLFRRAGRGAQAARFEADAARIAASVPRVLQIPGGSPHAGWLLSATGVGRQPDVWGTAYAAYCGLLTGEPAVRAGRALAAGYREHTAVRNGCVRQILTTDTAHGGGWERALEPVGEYQNGGWWATASGWYIAGLAHSDRSAAAAMAADYLAWLRSHAHAGEPSLAPEWFNPDTGRSANPGYAASVALVWCVLEECGLTSR